MYLKDRISGRTGCQMILHGLTYPSRSAFLYDPFNTKAFPSSVPSLSFRCLQNSKYSSIPRLSELFPIKSWILPKNRGTKGNFENQNMKTFTFFKNYLCLCKKSLCILQITHLLLSPLCTLFIIYSLSTELPENPSWKTSCRKQVLRMKRLCKKMYLFNAFSERRKRKRERERIQTSNWVNYGNRFSFLLLVRLNAFYLFVSCCHCHPHAFSCNCYSEQKEKSLRFAAKFHDLKVCDHRKAKQKKWCKHKESDWVQRKLYTIL